MIGTKPQSLITDSPSVSFTFQRIFAVIRPRYEVNRSRACYTRKFSQCPASNFNTGQSYERLLVCLIESDPRELLESSLPLQGKSFYPQPTFLYQAPSA